MSIFRRAKERRAGCRRPAGRSIELGFGPGQVSLSFVLLRHRLALQSLQKMQNPSPQFLDQNVIVSVVDYSGAQLIAVYTIFHTHVPPDRSRAPRR